MAKSKKYSTITSLKFVKGKMRELSLEKGTYNSHKAVVIPHKKKKESKDACRKFKGGQDENNDLL